MTYDEFMELVASISPQLVAEKSLRQPDVIQVTITPKCHALFALGEDLSEAEIRARLHQAATDGIDQLKKFRESLAK